MKKSMLFVLALVFVLACALPAAAKDYKVGVAIYQFDDNFMTLYRNELKAYFDELSAAGEDKYDVTIVDGKNDMAEQSNQIDNFITQGMDVIILNLVQTSSADAIIDQIVETEILAQFNHQSLIATKAQRVVHAADGRIVSDFGMASAGNARKNMIQMSCPLPARNAFSA